MDPMTSFGKRFRLIFSIAMMCFASNLAVAASGGLSSVGDLLKKAAENDNANNFQIVLSLALDTWPKKRVEILAMAETARSQWLKQDQAAELEEERKAVAAQEAASRARGVIYYLDPKLWNGKAELGAGSSTGDTQEKSLAAGLSFGRKFGEKWEHNLDMNFDFARSGSETTRQKFVAKYEALWRPWSNAFLLNYTELELDEFSGYDYRIVENIGVGFDLFKSGSQQLRLEGGPGLRFSKLEADGSVETEYLGRISSTYDLKLTSNLTLRDKTSVIFASESTTIENLAQFSARINSSLAARLGFEVKYDSAAPANTAAWDTATRATLVYGF
jgi:putative salt-induced outer membrane protein